MEIRKIPLKLKYNEPASHDIDNVFEDMGDTMNSSQSKILLNVNDDWERWSLPIGNGYFGVNVFGRCECEKFVIAEKTMSTAWLKSNDHLTGGLNTFANLYLDTNHKDSDVKSYRRELDLNQGITYVEYEYNGVKYYRESFTSYPDRCFVTKMVSSVCGKLDCTIRPIIPDKQEYMKEKGDRGGKTGNVKAWVNNNIGHFELSGNMEYYDIDYCGLINVFTDGKIEKEQIIDYHNDISDVLKITNSTYTYFICTLDTNYVLDSNVFLSKDDNKPTKNRDYKFVYDMVSSYMDSIMGKICNLNFLDGYDLLKANHMKDYTNLFSRVSLDLDFDENDYNKTTDELLYEYKDGKFSRYLEALYFQYGRYLLISSSRAGALPAHLQGVWNKYRQPMWTSGYWHNINVQMNYWPAFCTNLSETFISYIQYNDAYMKEAERHADKYVKQYSKELDGLDGGNGWCIGVGNWPNDISGERSAGNIGFTTQLFWDYYCFTQSKEILKNIVFPKLCNAARYITKCVKEDENGFYLVQHCDSPEQYVSGEWYYTVGTTYAQSFAYLNNYNLLCAAKELDIDENNEEYSILKTVLKQIDKYDPIIVGLSGQIKEFRQEKYYGDLGEYTHRHISNLVGLYPGNIITEETPAWLDASKVTLTNRGDKATGWGVAHRLNLWARTKNGDRAYDLYNQLLIRNTATNLWDLHPPFQIDGNLGGCAGVCEMLLQSHENYIDILPALPKVWVNGCYSGLKARGNFEISVVWQNGLIKELKIISKAGNRAKIKLSNVKDISVKTKIGIDVPYVYENGILSFDTEIDETYDVFGFSNIEKPNKVKDLELKINNEYISLSWNDDEPSLYRVYYAKDSDKKYTFLLETKEKMALILKKEYEKDERTTFCITKVKDNLEGDRELIYYVNE